MLNFNKKKFFVSYLTAGDPHLEFTAKSLWCFEKNGVDLVELGVPFSDPMADGPTNQQSHQRALKSGTSLETIFQMVSEQRKNGLMLQIILFSYLNPIYQYGIEKFASKAREAGIQGLLLVDLPVEYAENYARVLKQQGLCLVLLASPTTTIDRLPLIDKNGGGFLYYVSRAGVTGEQQSLSHSLREEVAKIKSEVHLPLAVGFGISAASHIKEILQYADGVIVGSALVKCLEEGTDKEKLQKLEQKVKELTSAMN